MAVPKGSRTTIVGPGLGCLEQRFATKDRCSGLYDHSGVCCGGFTVTLGHWPRAVAVGLAGRSRGVTVSASAILLEVRSRCVTRERRV